MFKPLTQPKCPAPNQEVEIKIIGKPLVICHTIRKGVSVFIVDGLSSGYVATRYDYDSAWDVVVTEHEYRLNQRIKQIEGIRYELSIWMDIDKV